MYNLSRNPHKLVILTLINKRNGDAESLTCLAPMVSHHIRAFVTRHCLSAHEVGASTLEV